MIRMDDGTKFGRMLSMLLVLGLFLCWSCSSVREACQQATITEYHKNGIPSGRGAVDANGEKTGEWIFWATNGSIIEKGHFLSGLETGLWKAWDEYSGEMYWSCEFKSGEMHGIWKTWHENGQLASKLQLFNGEPKGEFFLWYPNGQMELRAENVTGQMNGDPILDGVVTAWQEDGSVDLKRSGQFDAGKKVGD